MKNPNKISTFNRLLLLLAAMALVISIYVPLWRIELDAPQYPEGLSLSIYPNKIGGDVDIINGLNHYIGMQTLHTENFIEFTLLPYLIAGFAGLVLLGALVANKKVALGILILFAAFGIVAMADFWKWEYNYGHNLNPDAAIKVPGMAYQPPLIGFKQLLNFGAYSIPDIGGWLFIAAGAFLLYVVADEFSLLKKLLKNKVGGKVAIVLVIMSMGLITSCTQDGPQDIFLGKDKCDYCKMTISDNRFAAELQTDKGRFYKFDDISCLNGYVAENKATVAKNIWVCNFDKPGALLDVTKSYFIQDETLRSPMGGNIAAFSSLGFANRFAQKHKKEVQNWSVIQKIQ